MTDASGQQRRIRYTPKYLARPKPTTGGQYLGPRFYLPPTDSTRTTRVLIRHRHRTVLGLMWKYRIGPRKALKVKRLLRIITDRSIR